MEAIRTKKSGQLPINPIGTINGDRIQLEFDSSETYPCLVEGNPFADQEVFTGSLTYSEPSVIGGIEPKTETYKIQYRTGSGLFIIGDFGDYSRLDTVLSDTIEQIPGFRLGRVRSSRLGIWSFVFSSDFVPGIKVIDYESNELLDNSDIQISKASIKQISSEYSLYSAEVVFRYEDKEVNVSISDGTISFSQPPSDEAREYVLQRVETHIMGNVIIEELTEVNEDE